MAFLAYVNNEATPTTFEFQYYRSVSSHSASQQGDQVYVYTINSADKWSVIVREAYTKIVAGTGLSSSYSSGTFTLTGGTPTDVKINKEKGSNKNNFTQYQNSCLVAKNLSCNNGNINKIDININNKINQYGKGAYLLFL